MGEHEITESNDSVYVDGEGVSLNGVNAIAALNALVAAVEAGLDLTIQDVDYVREDQVSAVYDENRYLRYRLKQTNRNVGKQGETIHLLRSELAEVRLLSSRADRGDIRRLDRDNHRLKVLLDSAREEIAALNEKLTEQDVVDLDEETSNAVDR